MAHRVCPVWIGYLLINPIRKLFQHPEKILSQYISEGMTILDVGSAMGYFSIPLAKMTGPEGKVVCVDIQETMLDKLQKRADKFGVGSIIEKCKAEESSLNLENYKNMADFALAYAVAHEVPDQGSFFRDIHASLKDGGKILFSEPAGHVSEIDFINSVGIAERCGFQLSGTPKITRSLTVLLSKGSE